MASQIDPDFITPAPVSKTGMRVQLGYARDEITALQEDVAEIGTSFTQTGTGAVARSWNSKLREVGLYAGDFNADPTGVTDNTDALQALFDAADEQGKFAIIPDGTYRVNDPISLGVNAAGLIMRGKIVYYGTGIALTIGGADGTERAQYKRFEGLHVERNSITDWTSEAEVGILARNLDNSYLEVKRISGFTIGLQALGHALNSSNAHGFEDNYCYIGQIVNCRYGIDLRTDGQYSWNNACRWFGGHFTNSSTTNNTLSRFGVRLSRADGSSYNLHNQHVFYAPAFELQRRDTDGTDYRDAIPFLVEVTARAIRAHDVRMEACTNKVARHTVNATDCWYGIAYVGTWGYNVDVDYSAGVARLGGTVSITHQMGGVEETQRLVCAVDSVRDAAYYSEATEVNGLEFDKLALMYGTAAGTTLTAMVIDGRDSFELTANDVGHTGAYALGFVVDTSKCKDFSLAIGGNNLQIVVAQFDGNEDVLNGDYQVLMSDISSTYNATAQWWAAGTNFDATTAVTNEDAQRYYEHQRIRVHDDAQYAFIGVLGEGTMPTPTGRLKALRLYAPAKAHTPRVLYGGARSWGDRVRTVEISTSISQGPNSYSVVNHSIDGMRQGDKVHVVFNKTTGYQDGGLLLHPIPGAGTGSADTLAVVQHNISGGTINLDTGTLIVTWERRRA